MAEEGTTWQRSDGAQLISVRDYAGTLAFYTSDNHYVGVMSESEVRERGYVTLAELRLAAREEG